MTGRAFDLDIVIPARGENDNLGRLILALACDAGSLRLCIVVALNGENLDGMAHCVELHRDLLARADHDLRVLVVPEAGKFHALNAADVARSGSPVVYLDADVMIQPGLLAELSAALQGAGPRLVGPTREIIRPIGHLARSFVAIWSAMPGVDSFIGHGCYAVNPAGRARWAQFPPLLGDDAFVFSLFAPHERVLVAGVGLWTTFPQGRALVATYRRWQQGNAQLRRHRAFARPVVGTLCRLAARPRLWSAIPGFIVVKALAAVWRTPTVAENAWRPDRKSDAFQPSCRPKVRVVVVTCESAADIVRCLDAIASHWAALEIIVVDNGSRDHSAALAEHHASVTKVIRNSDNRGFAVAANQGAADTTADSLLFLNPDAVLPANGIDTLVALALYRPAAGLYGCRMVDDTGRLDHTSALARPGLLPSFVFALGLTLLPGGRWLDPDWLGAWDRRGTRAVPVLTAAALLVDAALWQRLGGFDERYFLYGEDVDLCLRATAIGAQPIATGASQYVHLGGASSTNGSDRMVRILRGKAALLRRQGHGRLGLALLHMGVALRAGLETLVREGRCWRTCWARRNEWRRPFQGWR